MLSSINKCLNDLITSFEETLENYSTYRDSLIASFNQITQGIINEKLFDNFPQTHLTELKIRKKLLCPESSRNYFTISSRDSFSDMPSENISLNWGKSLVFFPLNDHSRTFLKKGDVLFCYRQGQFSDLNDALNMRGIYAIGIAASDPVELFPDKIGHERWGVLVCFPIILPKHLELRNIQLHPDTIDLTPYNGNRNDSLQHIIKPSHYLTLLNLIYSKNIELKEFFEVFFTDLNLTKIKLPDLVWEREKAKIRHTSNNINSLKIKFIQNKFILWFYKPENYKKSYEGLVNLKVLNFWDENFFNSKLFKLNLENISESVIQIEKIILEKNNIEWKNYSEATSKGSPEAVLGKNNYIKFLHEFILINDNIENLRLIETIYENKSFNFSLFKQDTNYAGLIFSNEIIKRFIASLCTKQFLILTGLSGSGKTKLAQAFAKWISESPNQYLLVPVGADWTNREPLLGYPNSLEPRKYVTPESGVIQIISNSIENPDKPYFLILDEMNLSHVERYFADFLSAMESKDSIKLYSDSDRYTKFDDNKEPLESSKVFDSFKLPPNLFIIGTVNIDETTYMFSPKVLDRANTIEFRLNINDLEKYFENTNAINLANLHEGGNKFLPGLGFNQSKSFMNLVYKSNDIIDYSAITDVSIKFFNNLKIAGAEFGYRSINEIAKLVVNLQILGSDLNEAIDFAVMQKLLPKLHGSRSKMVRVLPLLADSCIDDVSAKAFLDEYVKGDDIFSKYKDQIIYPVSLEKICRMYKNALDNGFTSYAEA